MQEFHPRRSLAGVLVGSFLLVSFLSPSLEAAQVGPSARDRRKRWLESVREKVMKDSRRLVELAAEMRAEAGKRGQSPLPRALQKRVDALEPEARKLQTALESFDENFLAVPVITTAEGIEAEAKYLRQALRVLPQSSRWSRLGRLAHEMEKRADSVKDRTRMP